MNTEEKDPIKASIARIVEITRDIYTRYKAEGKTAEAAQLILWVAFHLHTILVKRERIVKENPFTPDVVKARYYLTKCRSSKGVKRTTSL